MEDFLKKYEVALETSETVLCTGKVVSVNGLEIVSNGPRAMIGELCTIYLPQKQESEKKIFAEVVGLETSRVKLAAFGDTKGIEIGCEVVASGHTLEIPVGKSLLGRVIDATGAPIDKKGPIKAEKFYPALASPPDPLSRAPINKRIVTGVRAIDSLLTVGKGQRLGIFAGSGVGKSTLLSMIARNTNADVNVIALVGERGREVNDFLERDLGEEGLKRSVVVVATSDKPSIARLRAAYVATAIAEYFRDEGKDVMFMFDNLTRFAHAQREIGLSSGEPPAQSGYPPSVFDLLPKLLERTGTNDRGSITAFYNVLVDGDDLTEPIADKVRGTLDGHIVLSRSLAASRHYPAIDILQSISRLSKRVSGKNTVAAVANITRLISLYERNEDMINAGAYQKGANAEIDLAIEKHNEIENFLCQEEYEPCPIEETLQKLSELSGIEIPNEEFSETPAPKRKTSAQMAKENSPKIIPNENLNFQNEIQGKKI